MSDFSRIGPDRASSLGWRRGALHSLESTVRTEDLLGKRFERTTLGGAFLQARGSLLDAEQVLKGFGVKDDWDASFVNPPQLQHFDEEVLPSLVYAVEDLAERRPVAEAKTKRSFEPREIPAEGSIGETMDGRVELDTVKVAYPFSVVPRFDRPSLNLVGHNEQGRQFQVQVETHIETLLPLIDGPRPGPVQNDKVDGAWHREWTLERQGERIRISHEGWKASLEVDRMALASALGL